MMDVEGRPRVHHPMSSYIDYGKDKQGMTQAMLRIPHWVKTDPLPPTPSIEFLPPGLDWGNRGMADGGSPDTCKGSRSPHLTTTVGVSGTQCDALLLTVFANCIYFRSSQSSVHHHEPNNLQ